MTVIPSAISTSELIRNRTWFGWAQQVEKVTGGRRRRTITSVQVTGRSFPARMWNGTPCQRQEST